MSAPCVVEVTPTRKDGTHQSPRTKPIGVSTSSTMTIAIHYRRLEMAIKEYQYQKATQAQLLKCIGWCQNQFQLRDWEIQLSIGDTRPPEFEDGSPSVEQAEVTYSTVRLKAVIWINDTVIIQKGLSLYSAVIHEMLHILIGISYDNDNDELIVRSLEPLIYRLYCKENGLKITPEKLGF